MSQPDDPSIDGAGGARRNFTRTVEDFTCVHCGLPVRGDGYTNHCPRCLWSRHVDVVPGDRAERCGGAMRPVAVEVRGAGYAVRHRCEGCGAVRSTRAHVADSVEALTEVARAHAEAVSRGTAPAAPGPVRRGMPRRRR